MSTVTRGARPIRDKDVADWYKKHTYQDVSMQEYGDVWKNWLEYTTLKSITGLDLFPHVAYTQGTSQTFDNFVLRHAKDRQLLVLRGDFQYHACLGKHVQFKYVELSNYIEQDILGPGLHSLIISAPFSDFGCIHPEFEQLMRICNVMDIPVCLDLAYWGIAKHVHIDLNDFPAIKEVTCSLSKPFFTLENHRVGVRFTREYADDGISMLNEVQMQNKHSMSLGVHYMKHFSPDFMWDKYHDEHYHTCNKLDLFLTDTIIFGISNDDKYKEFNRGIPDNHRVCISEHLSDYDS